MPETRTYSPAAGRFTDWLAAGHAERWQAACSHRFTRELADDSLDEAAYSRYLVQDYAFLETLATVLGHAVAAAPGIPAKRRFAAFLAAVTSEENDYFIRSFAALGVSETDWSTATLNPTTRAFADLMLSAARTGNYEEILAVLVPAEWIYLNWASAVAEQKPLRFFYREWIELHANPVFEEFVDWMRGELDRVGPALPPERQQAVVGRFNRLVDLEVDFFDAAYRSG